MFKIESFRYELNHFGVHTMESAFIESSRIDVYIFNMKLNTDMTMALWEPVELSGDSAEELCQRAFGCG